MGEDISRFINDFATLVRLAQSGLEPDPKGERLLSVLSGHLGQPAEDLPVVLEEVRSHRFVDVDILMAEEVGTDPEARLIGVGGEQRHHVSLSDMLQRSGIFPQFSVSQPDYTNVAVGPDEQRQAVALGIWLFHRKGVPLVVMQRNASPNYGRMTVSLEVLSPDAGAGAEFLAGLRRRLQNESILKGQVISLTLEEYGSQTAGVTIHARPSLSAADVVLPPGLLQKISAHALGIAVHREALRASGQHLKRGILLYGPPGTGKTHTVRHLLSESHGTTAILLSGGSLAHISEAARMARALQPSIVVLEDCDLIAEDRSFGHGPQPLLFEVLDAMDGLDDDADVTFVLTTNRADLLEPALAQRPGRVDLAVEIPLPSEKERAELLTLYSREIGFSTEAVAEAARNTAGTTASFARELVRRAVVAAAIDNARVADVHLRSAVDDLMADSAALTRSLLGSRSDTGFDRYGHAAPDASGPAF